MMALSSIRALARQAAEEAAANRRVPFVYYNEDEVRGARPNIPFLGDYVPDGWELVDTHFVDSSGYGNDSEPALSHRQFEDRIIERIKANRPKRTGWAVTEAGQFQVYVGEYVIE